MQAIEAPRPAIQISLLTGFLTLFCLVIPFTVEWLTRGQSLGKYALGLRVVRDDGGPVAGRHVFVRTLTAVIELWLTAGCVAFLIAFISPRSKRGGDLLAGTYVITERTLKAPALPLVCPPELLAWSRTADVRRLPPQLAMAGRRMLMSTSTLVGPRRVQLATTLAAEYENFVSPPPPWGTNPERFIAAVLTTRRDREYAQQLRKNEQRAAEKAALHHPSYGIM